MIEVRQLLVPHLWAAHTGCELHAPTHATSNRCVRPLFRGLQMVLLILFNQRGQPLFAYARVLCSGLDVPKLCFVVNVWQWASETRTSVSLTRKLISHPFILIRQTPSPSSSIVLSEDFRTQSTSRLVRLSITNKLIQKNFACWGTFTHFFRHKYQT